MSLQDDYFDLRDSLKGKQLQQFERVWFAYCDLEAQQMVREGSTTKADYLGWKKQREHDLGMVSK